MIEAKSKKVQHMLALLETFKKQVLPATVLFEDMEQSSADALNAIYLMILMDMVQAHVVKHQIETGERMIASNPAFHQPQLEALKMQLLKLNPEEHKGELMLMDLILFSKEQGGGLS